MEFPEILLAFSEKKEKGARRQIWQVREEQPEIPKYCVAGWI